MVFVRRPYLRVFQRCRPGRKELKNPSCNTSIPGAVGHRVVKLVHAEGDAAFAKPECYEALEERDVKYAIRLPANDNLGRNIT